MVISEQTKILRRAELFLCPEELVSQKAARRKDIQHVVRPYNTQKDLGEKML